VRLVFANARSGYAGICKKIAAAAETELGQSARTEAGINFVSAGEIKTLNKNFRNRDEATDTLSFPFLELSPGEAADSVKHRYALNPHTKRVMLGEVYVDPERIRAQAAEYGHGFERELAYIAAHGLLHLFGSDHAAEDEEKRMSALAERITAAAGYRREV
jgi:probable rRNA maturation factor